MARPLRIQYPGAFYHVTSRGNAKGDIYLSNLDKRKFLEILGAVCEKYEWNCYAYCLMNNHYHLLIQTPLSNLSQGMRQLNGVYTQVFNKINERVGHVLQGRYKAILVDKDLYLLELTRYIVLNPVRAKLVDHVSEWPWSSYQATVGSAQTPIWLAVEELLRYFNNNKNLALENYIKFVKDGLDCRSPFENLSQQIFLGSEEFVYNAQKQINNFLDLEEIPKPQLNKPSKFKTLQEYQDFFSSKTEAIVAAYDSGLFSLKEIGSHFKFHYTTISKKVHKFKSNAKFKI